MASLEKTGTKKQLELLCVLKVQLDLVYRQLNHFRGACKSVDRFNRAVRGILNEETDRQHYAIEINDGQLGLNRLHSEFVKFERNYRISRKRLFKLNRILLSSNPYDKLYDLYESLVIGESNGIDENLNVDLSEKETAAIDEVSCIRPVRTDDSPVDDNFTSTGIDSRFEDCIPEIQLDTRQIETSNYASSIDSSFQTDDSFRVSSQPSNHSSNLSIQKRTHGSELPFRCSVKGCGFGTSRPSHLKTHEMTIHTGERPFQCGQCHKSFKHMSNLSIHKRSHIIKPRFKCSIEGCDYGTQYPVSLRKHEMTSHTNDRLFQCSWEGCDFRAHHYGSLKCHQKMHTGDQLLKSEFSKLNTNCSDTIKTSQSNNIELYLELYNMYENLHVDSSRIDPAAVDEVSRAMGIEDTPVNDNFASIAHSNNCVQKIQSDSRQLETSSFTPSIDSSSLLQMTNASDSQQFSGSQSNNLYKSPDILSQHKWTHSSEPPFRCSMEGCDYGTDQPSHLKTHKMTIHTNDRPFQCGQCHKSFRHASNLSIHKRSHISKPRFKCSIEGCDYGTQYPVSLKNHEMTNHTGTRAFYCDVCGNSFKHLSTLNLHKRTHDSVLWFKCSVEGCDFRSNHANLLKAHEMTVHANYRPLQCSWEGCDFRANRVDYIKTHQNVHTGQRPFQCWQCGKSFKFSSNLSIHKRTHMAIPVTMTDLSVTNNPHMENQAIKPVIY